MGKTKKLGIVARFGARYGRGVKARFLAVELKEKKKHFCLSCGFRKVKRVSTALYKCLKCEKTFAGGAYTLKTQTGEIAEKMVKQSDFASGKKELLMAMEGAEKEAEPEAEKKEDD